MLSWGREKQAFTFLHTPKFFVKLAIHRYSIKKPVRSSRPEVFCKKGVPKNLTKFSGKHLCWSLF